nr:hypothetical protein [Tanacetum cinerariifolium]
MMVDGETMVMEQRVVVNIGAGRLAVAVKRIGGCVIESKESDITREKE